MEMYLMDWSHGVSEMEITLLFSVNTNSDILLIN